MPVRSKTEFYRRFHAGEFGNRPQTWQTVEAYLASGFGGLVGIRSRERGGPCSYYNTRDEIVRKTATWPCAYSLTEAMPDDVLVLQGEVSRLPGGICLTYGDRPNVTMREAMKSPKTARGIVAIEILRTRLWPASYDDVMDLLDRYDDAVIEFGAHDRAVGVMPNRNAVIWEVRNY